MVEGGCVEKLGFAVGVEISKGGAQFLSGLEDFGSGVELSISDGVVDDLDGFEIGLEFDEVVHHVVGGGVEVDFAEFREILKPQFFEGGSDVFRFQLLEEILDFVHGPGVSSFFGHLLLQKLHEVGADGGVDEHISVESGVVVAFKNLDVPHFREISKRVNVIHEQFDIDLVLESLYDVDDVVELVPDGDHVEELDKHAGGVALDVLDFICEFSFEAGAHQGDRDVGVVEEQVGAVVGVLQKLDRGMGTVLSSSRVVQFLIWVYCCSLKKEERNPRMMASAKPLSTAKVHIYIVYQSDYDRNFIQQINHPALNIRIVRSNWGINIRRGSGVEDQEGHHVHVVGSFVENFLF